MLFNGTLANCSSDKYVDADNSLTISEEVMSIKLTGVINYNKTVLRKPSMETGK